MSTPEPEAIFDCRPNLLVSDLSASLLCYSEVPADWLIRPTPR